MGYAADHQPSILELARSGNFQAIAYWLNVFLLPHNLFAQVNSASRSGCVQVLVEFHPSPEVDARSPEFQKSLVRFICHHIWQLNSDAVEGVQVVARFVGTPQVLWKQTVRVVSPARRAKLEQRQPSKPTLEQAHLKTRIRQVTRQKVQFRALRSLLLTGTTAAAFILGCWLGYADAPSEQTTASANSTVEARPDTVTTTIGTVPVETPASQSTDGTATLVFAGDVALTNAYTDLVGTDHKWAFSALDEVRQADVTMVNLEAPFTSATTPNPKQSEPFKSDPTKVEVLKHGGIDLVNLANNRTMDYQAAGLSETLKTLDEAGIRHVGAGLDAKQARRPTILDVDGQRIAYLGYYDSDVQAAGATQAGTNFRDRDRIAADIKALRDQVDWVVVNFHWGEEISKYPADWQIELAHTTIEQGADLVVGHHSSVLQGAEIYKGRPIIYSLGNFIFGGASQSDYDTAMLKVALKDQQMKVELLPVEVKGFQPRVMSGDRGKEILQQVEMVSDIFQQPLKSPVILDARSNSIISHPEAAPTKVQPSSESPNPEAQPSAPGFEAPNPETQPSEPSLESPNPEVQPSEPSLEAPSPETQPSESFFESPSPATPVSPDSQLQPESSSPTPSATPASGQPSAQPWNDNSFISNPSAAPMVPQQEVSPSPEIPSGDAGSEFRQTPEGRGNASIAPVSPMNSLEPMKRRYAETVPSATQAFLNP